MQTMSVQIQDNYMPQFINYVQEHNDNIVISKDENLEYDPYFYDRQKQLQQDINDIDGGNVKMINNTDFWNDIDAFTESLN
jgi:hypothetical protein